MRIGSGAILAVFDQGFFSASVLCTNFLLIRFLSEGEFADFVLKYTVLTAALGLHNALIIEAYSVYATTVYSSNRQGFLSSILLRNLKWFGFPLAFGSVLLLSLAIYHSSGNLLALAAGLLLTFFALTWPLLRAHLHFSESQWISALAGAFFFAFNFASMWILASENKLNAILAIIIILLAYFFLTVSVLCYLYFRSREDLRAVDLGPNYMVGHWKYSKWVILSAVVLPLAFNGYYWFLSIVGKEALIVEIRAVAIFSLLLQQGMAALSWVVLKRVGALVHENSFASLERMLRRWFRYGLIFALLFFIFFEFAGPKIFQLAYESKYGEVFPYFKFFFLYVVINFANFLVNPCIKATGDSRTLFAGYAAQAIVAFSIGFPLVYQFGIVGYIIGLTASEFINTLVLRRKYCEIKKQRGSPRLEGF